MKKNKKVKNRSRSRKAKKKNKNSSTASKSSKSSKTRSFKEDQNYLTPENNKILPDKKPESKSKISISKKENLINEISKERLIKTSDIQIKVPYESKLIMIELRQEMDLVIQELTTNMSKMWKLNSEKQKEMRISEHSFENILHPNSDESIQEKEIQRLSYRVKAFFNEIFQKTDQMMVVDNHYKYPVVQTEEPRDPSLKLKQMSIIEEIHELVQSIAEEYSIYQNQFLKEMKRMIEEKMLYPMTDPGKVGLYEIKSKKLITTFQEFVQKFIRREQKIFRFIELKLLRMIETLHERKKRLVEEITRELELALELEDFVDSLPQEHGPSKLDKMLYEGSQQSEDEDEMLFREFLND